MLAGVRQRLRVAEEEVERMVRQELENVIIKELAGEVKKNKRDMAGGTATRGLLLSEETMVRSLLALLVQRYTLHLNGAYIEPHCTFIEPLGDKKLVGVGGHAGTQFTCFTGIKVQIITG
jgi:hypothetical protein